MGQIDIKRLLNAVKVEDEPILAGESITLSLYGRELVIRQLNWWKQWGKFAKWLGNFLQLYSVSCEALGLPDKVSDFQAFRKGIRLTISNAVWGKVAFKNLVKMCRLYGDVKWMKKNFTLDDWCEVFLYVYLYNIFGVKKNLSVIWRVIKKVNK